MMINRIYYSIRVQADMLTMTYNSELVPHQFEQYASAEIKSKFETSEKIRLANERASGR